PVNGGNGVPISLGGERQAGCSEPRRKSWITEYPAQCLGERVGVAGWHPKQPVDLGRGADLARWRRGAHWYAEREGGGHGAGLAGASIVERKGCHVGCAEQPGDLRVWEVAGDVNPLGHSCLGDHLVELLQYLLGNRCIDRVAPPPAKEQEVPLGPGVPDRGDGGDQPVKRLDGMEEPEEGDQRCVVRGTEIATDASASLGIEARLDPDVQADRHLERRRLAVAEACPENLELLS